MSHAACNFFQIHFKINLLNERQRCNQTAATASVASGQKMRIRIQRVNSTCWKLFFFIFCCVILGWQYENKTQIK